MAKKILVNNNNAYVEMKKLPDNTYELYWHDWVVNEWKQKFPSKQAAIKFVEQDILEGVEQLWIN